MVHVRIETGGGTAGGRGGQKRSKRRKGKVTRQICDLRERGRDNQCCQRTDGTLNHHTRFGSPSFVATLL